MKYGYIWQLSLWFAVLLITVSESIPILSEQEKVVESSVLQKSMSSAESPSSTASWLTAVKAWFASSRNQHQDDSIHHNGSNEQKVLSPDSSFGTSIFRALETIPNALGLDWDQYVSDPVAQGLVIKTQYGTIQGKIATSWNRVRMFLGYLLVPLLSGEHI